jgi:type IV pilus assembly protein PilE
MMKLAQMKGVTLVELMVTLAVLSILVTVGYPLYADQVRKARRTEARNALMEVALLQERYFSVNGTYDVGLNSLSLTKDSFDTGTATATTAKTVNGKYLVTLTNDATTFSISAAPVSGKGQDEDDDCQQFDIDQLGQKTALDDGGSATTKCW